MSASEDEDDFLEFTEAVTFTIEYTFDDGDTVAWQPPLVTKLTANQVGDSDAIVDGCGNRERRSAESTSWQLDVEGLALKPDVAVLRELELADKEVNIVTEIDEFTAVTVDDVEVTMEEGKPKARFPNRPITPYTRNQANERSALTEGLVFTFHIQTEEPDDGGSGFFSQ